MRVDVLAVGTELLLGQIIDTNSSWLGEHLAMHGLHSLSQVKVGDNIDRIVGHMERMLGEADAVIVCGGLGPTHDDLTREAIARVMGVDLHLDTDVADVIRHLFSSRGRTMPENNLRQAMVPAGATIIEQTRGTAPGLICPVDRADGLTGVLYAVPGVPHEMRDMFHRAIAPDLLRRAGRSATIVSRTLRTWGESESGLDERLRGVITELDDVGNPTLAFLASGWEGLKVRLTAAGDDADHASAVLAPWEQRIRDILGDQIFGTDDQTMESVVLDLLADRGRTLAVAESVTGGLVAGRLTAVPGASRVFRGGLVSYASEVKFDLLGVAPGPVVTADAAEAMAVGVCEQLGSDVGVALTGVAGPEPQDGEGPGTLFVGIALPDTEGRRVRSIRLRMPGDRDMMRQLSVISALDFLRRDLLAHG